VEVAQRIRDFVVEHGMRESDLIFDPLTFTLGTGQEELRRSGQETLEAIAEIDRRMPDSHTILGLSNCSFGLNPAARQVLNSVFLFHAVEAGLDMAIVHASKIQPLNRLDEEGAEIARKLIFDLREWEEAPVQGA
jgi:5-methyltetrahydrofolate--homocysteine methyltransferase